MPLNPTLLQDTLPARFATLTPEETAAAIRSAKERLGTSTLILGHHYQRDDVYRWADITGDSFLLSQRAAARTDARYIVFCGVHFMAESADILKAPHQTVLLPDLNAGCHLADCAEPLDVENCWDDLIRAVGNTVLPVTYMNSAASLKAFVGQAGGAVCTSSNAERVFQWAFGQKPKILFFPDEHLGWNTADRLEIPEEEVVVWDFRQPYLGGNTEESLRKARLVLWKGFCSVHIKFLPEHVDEARVRYSGVRVICHPECMRSVCRKADLVGSTEFILKTIRSAPEGSSWAIGTELNLVHRIAQEETKKTVVSLNPNACLCSTMYRIDGSHLLWTLENLLEERVVNEVRVPEGIARWARLSLERMLAIP